MGTVTATLVLTWGKAGILLAVGVAAGIFNGVAGGGTLLAFPTLLALGVPALTANLTSAVGVVPSYVGGVAGFRSEIKDLRHQIRRLLPAIILGGAAGSLLLLTTPATSFRSIVPWLVGLATVLFAAQPLVAKAMRSIGHDHPTRRLLLQIGTAATAVYGGYFGAGMGVMLLAVFGIALVDSLAHLSGLRSITSVIVNGLAALIFVFSGHVLWLPALCLALGTLAGGWAGATWARTLPVPVLRIIVVAVGTATTIVLFAN